MSDVDPFETPKELAKQLREKVGLSSGYSSDLAAGIRSPSLALAAKIEDALGIAPSRWVDHKASRAA